MEVKNQPKLRAYVGLAIAVAVLGIFYEYFEHSVWPIDGIFRVKNDVKVSGGSLGFPFFPKGVILPLSLVNPLQ